MPRDRSVSAMEVHLFLFSHSISLFSPKGEVVAARSAAPLSRPTVWRGSNYPLVHLAPGRWKGSRTLGKRCSMVPRRRAIGCRLAA